MSTRDRLPLFPSRANLVLMKHRIVGATKGLSLLKLKRDALDVHLRKFVRELKTNREQMNDIMEDAIFSLSKVNYLCTDLKPATVLCPDRADVYMRIKTEKIIGITIEKLNLILRPSTSLPFTGLSTGGRKVEEVRFRFQEALRILTSMASLDFAVQTLTGAVHQTNMRVNGLQYVLLPRFINTSNYIRDELEELEREDFYRLKRSQRIQRIKQKEKLITKTSVYDILFTNPSEIDDFDKTSPSVSFVGLQKPEIMQILSRKHISFIRNKTIVMKSNSVTPVTSLDVVVHQVEKKKEPKRTAKFIVSDESESDN